MKPIIGVVEWPYTDKDNDEIYEIRTNIIEWIVRAGGKPIGIFPTQIQDFVNTRLRDLSDMTKEEEQDLNDTLNMCDAIIKPGALKIYNYERYIYHYTLEHDMPYLGICGGMQIMASDSRDMVENVRNYSDVIHHSKEEYVHLIKLEEDSKLKIMLKKDKIMVNSLHNYHIKDEGNNSIAARAADRYIEAIENNDKLFHLGVQWHPELLPESDENSQIIFGEFIDAAKTYQKRK